MRMRVRAGQGMAGHRPGSHPRSRRTIAWCQGCGLPFAVTNARSHWSQASSRHRTTGCSGLTGMWQWSYGTDLGIFPVWPSFLEICYIFFLFFFMYLLPFSYWMFSVTSMSCGPGTRFAPTRLTASRVAWLNARSRWRRLLMGLTSASPVSLPPPPRDRRPPSKAFGANTGLSSWLPPPQTLEILLFPLGGRSSGPARASRSSVADSERTRRQTAAPRDALAFPTAVVPPLLSPPLACLVDPRISPPCRCSLAPYPKRPSPR